VEWVCPPPTAKGALPISVQTQQMELFNSAKSIHLFRRIGLCVNVHVAGVCVRACACACVRVYVRVAWQQQNARVSNSACRHEWSGESCQSDRVLLLFSLSLSLSRSLSLSLSPSLSLSLSLSLSPRVGRGRGYFYSTLCLSTHQNVPRAHRRRRRHQ